MSYSDSLQVLGIDLTPVQVEASAAEIKDYVMPVAGQVEDFGAYITEDFVAQATDPVVAIGTKETFGGTYTAKISLTLGSSNTTLKKGDAQRAAQTAIAADTDLDNGQVVHGKQSSLPFKFNAGQVITLDHETAASGAGGAFVPFFVVRFSLGQPERTNVWIQDD